MYKKFLSGVLALTLTIGGTVLPACAQTNIDVSSVSTAVQASSDGFDYEILSDGGIEITKYTGSDTEVTIPDTIDGKKVISIGDNAFANCKNLIKVDLPKNLTKIGSNAFRWCEKLKNVVIPSGVKTIGDSAFISCTSFTDITIPSGVTYIGTRAFRYCRNIASMSIPDSVEYAGKDAFDDNPWFENHADGLLYVGKTAYKYFGTMAENAAVELKSGTTMIGASAFKNCPVGSVSIPNTVKVIDDAAFYGTNLSQVTVPNSVETIGSEVFFSCSNLSKVTLPNNLSEISSGMFRECSSLESISIPSIVEKIGSYAFTNCKKLSSSPIPSKVTSIGAYAFSGCTSLENIKLPSSLTTIDSNAFASTAIKSAVIPDGVTQIPSNLFMDCTNLSSVTLSNKAEKIGYSAFKNTAISTIKLPDTLTEIGSEAFYRCPNLKSVSVPASVTKIYRRALGYDYDLTAGTVTKVDGFKIYCTAGSAAETYAKDNEFSFETQSQPAVKDISNCTVTIREAAEFTGLSIKATVKVKDGTKSLTNGKDFSVKYTDNKLVGTATATITGKGNYTGTVVKTFKIIKKSVDTCDVTLSKTSASFNNTAIKPDVTVRIGDEVINSRNYDVKYTNNVNVGKATVTITGKNNLKGKVTKTFRISARSLSKCKISLSGTSFKYTGSEIKPKVTVGVTGSDTPVDSSNYTVTYTNNVNKGTATVTITGKGNLKDTFTKTFTIK